MRTYLLADDGIAAVVAARVYPLRLPQPRRNDVMWPAITMTRIDDHRVDHLRGQGGVAQPDIQLDCWATTVEAAAALGCQCRRRLEGYVGVWSSAAAPPMAPTVIVQLGIPLFLPYAMPPARRMARAGEEDTIWVQGIRHLTERDLFEEDIHGGLCRHSADYRIVHFTNGEAI